MPVPAGLGPRATNLEVVRAVIESLGLLDGPDGAWKVEKFDVPYEHAVEIELKGAFGTSLVRVEPPGPERPGAVRTKSFTLVQGPGVTRESDAAFRKFAEALAARDPGDFKLQTVPQHKGRGIMMPVLNDNFMNRDPVWKREIFSERLSRLDRAKLQGCTVNIVVFQHCGYACVFCPTSDGPQEHRVGDGKGSAEHHQDLLFMIEQGRTIGAEVADFCGSDVLRFPTVIELFEAAGKAGYKRIIAQSPGQILADPAFAKRVADSPCTDLFIPLYGTNAAVHDDVTGTKGSFEGVLKAIDNVLSHGKQRVQLHTIPLKRNVKYLVELIDFARERFGLPVFVNHLRPNRDGEKDHLVETVKFADLRPIIAQRPLNFPDHPYCQMRREDALERWRMYMQTYAKLYGGGRPSVNFYDLGLPDNSEQPQVRYERLYRHAKPCESCLMKDMCPKVLGAYLGMFGEDELVPFTERAELDAALARTGEPFAGSAYPIEQRIELVLGAAPPEIFAQLYR